MNRKNPDRIDFDLTDLQPKQWALLDAIEEGIRHPFYGGARGGGKSYASRKIMIFRRLKYPGTSGLLLRRTFKQLERNHVRKMFQEYPWLKPWYSATHQRIDFPNGSLLELGHCEHESDVENFQGPEYDDIAVEEVTQFTEFIWTRLAAANRSVSTIPGFKPCMWATGNPGGTGHLFAKRLWIDRMYKANEKPERYFYIPARVYDNKVLMENDPDYLDNLEAIEDEDLRRAWLEGDWDVYPGQFFTTFRKEKLVIDPFPIPDSWHIFEGLDHGTTAPTSFGRYALNHNGVLIRLWEYYMPDRATFQHAEAIASLRANCPYSRRLKARRSLADPSLWIREKLDTASGRAPIDEYIKRDLRFVKANNSRVQGWDLCKDILAQGLFKVFRGRNENFLRTIPALSRDDNNWEDIDTHQEDHAADEWRYVVMHAYRPARASLPKRPQDAVTRMLHSFVEEQQDMDRMGQDPTRGHSYSGSSRFKRMRNA